MPLFDVLSHIAGTTAVTGMSVNTSSGISNEVHINTTVLECTVKKVDGSSNKAGTASNPAAKVSPAPTPAPAPAPSAPTTPKTSKPKSPKPGKKSPPRSVCSDVKYDGLAYSRVIDVGTVVDKKGHVLGGGRPVCGLPLSRSGLYVAVGIPGRATPLPVTRGYADWVQVSKDAAVPPAPKPVPQKK